MGADQGLADRALDVAQGSGYLRSGPVERLFRESMLFRIAPISRELVKCFIAEKVLGLPKSY